MGLSTHVWVFFDRHVELLLQLSHGADSLRKLLHVPPVEHATVHCVVVHVLAYPANFWGRKNKNTQTGVKKLGVNVQQNVNEGWSSVTFLHTSVSWSGDSLSPELQQAPHCDS